jgi:hypothetical protein
MFDQGIVAWAAGAGGVDLGWLKDALSTWFG